MLQDDAAAHHGGAEAIRWLADFARDRAEELLCVVHGKRPGYKTNAYADDRDELLLRLE